MCRQTEALEGVVFSDTGSFSWAPPGPHLSAGTLRSSAAPGYAPVSSDVIPERLACPGGTAIR